MYQACSHVSVVFLRVSHLMSNA